MFSIQFFLSFRLCCKMAGCHEWEGHMSSCRGRTGGISICYTATGSFCFNQVDAHRGLFHTTWIARNVCCHGPLKSVVLVNFDLSRNPHMLRNLPAPTLCQSSRCLISSACSLPGTQNSTSSWSHRKLEGSQTLNLRLICLVVSICQGHLIPVPWWMRYEIACRVTSARPQTLLDCVKERHSLSWCQCSPVLTVTPSVVCSNIWKIGDYKIWLHVSLTSSLAMDIFYFL